MGRVGVTTGAVRDWTFGRLRACVFSQPPCSRSFWRVRRPPRTRPYDGLRPFAAGSVRKRLRGLLPVRLRRLAGEESLPDDKTRWGRYDEMAERNREKLRTLLEEAATRSSRVRRRAAGRRLLRRLHGRAAAKRKGGAPIGPYLDRIDRLQTGRPVRPSPPCIGRASRRCSRSVEPDLRNASRVIAGVDQGGLGLPDRDYYLKTDPKNVERRARYVEHVQRMFELANRRAPGPARTRNGDAD